MTIITKSRNIWIRPKRLHLFLQLELDLNVILHLEKRAVSWVVQRWASVLFTCLVLIGCKADLDEDQTVSLISLAVTFCVPSPPVCFWTNKTESKMSRVTGVRLHFACACAQRSGIVLLWPNNEETMQSVGSLLECYFWAVVSNLRNGANKNVNIFDTHVICRSITHL